MYKNPRRQKSFKKKVLRYILALAILIFLLLFLKSDVTYKKPLFISPLGRENMDLTMTKKILKENNILFSNVVAMSDYYIINIPNNGQVKIPATKDISKQIASLQRILVQLTIEGKLFKSIDFRFEEPVISF